MASDRNDRFATAVDFARALQRVELELGYTPTAIDVPNLLIEAPQRDGEADDDDATRARTVATIQAQPDRPTVAAVIALNDDSTVVRGAKNIVAQPVAAPAGAVQEETVVRRKSAPVVEALTSLPPGIGQKPSDW